MERHPTTGSEIFESLTGYDEIVIGERFGAPAEDLEGAKLGRCLIFTVKRREGLNDEEAYVAAMSLTMKAVSEFFIPEGDVTSGKELPSSDLLLESLQPSA
jgi:hypothetical protein